MGLKDQIDKAVDDAGDTIDEAKHRTQAEAERANRDANGDLMPAGDKAKSMVDEAGHRVAAEADRAKRAVRDHT
jgi:vacuolar-type H+-ATPase subunit H